MVRGLKDLSEMGVFAAEAIKHGTVSFIAWNREGRLLTVNQRFYLLSGYTSEDVESMRWPADFAGDNLAGLIEKTMDEQGQDGRSHRFDGIISKKDGTLLPVDVFMNAYRSPGSDEPVFFAFITDITMNKEQERQLQLTQFALDQFTDPSIWVDAGGQVVYANDTACMALGYTREELLSMKIWQIDPQSTPEKQAGVWNYARMAGDIKFKTMNRSKDGKEFPIEIHCSYIRFHEQELLICFARDITERVNAEEALADSEEKFRVLTDTALSAIFLVSENKFIYANPAALQLTGYLPAELYEMHYWDIISPEFRGAMIEYGDRLHKGESVPDRFEIKFLRKDGGEGWSDISVALAKYRGRKGVTGVITALDVTERKRSEEALRESEEKFRVLSELSPSAIFLYQGDKLIYANPAGVSLTGYNIRELLSKNFWDMIHPEYREMVKMYGLARQRGEPVPTRYEIKYVTKNYEQRWAEFTAGLVEYKGRPAGIVTAYDITERKLTEIALNDARLQAELYVDLMGHDINNLNMAAMGFLELASDTLKSQGTPCNEVLQMITGAMNSLAGSSSLIGSVRKLQKERKGILQQKYISLNRVLSAVKERYAKFPGRDITITYSAICDCCVNANELLIDVFMNLVGNSIKHSSGPLAINIGLQSVEEKGMIFCRIAFEDTGPGIPDEQKPGIFDRFGKDKAKLTGKGLGLYLVKTLVDDFQGRVWVEDRVKGDYKKGARFVVMLPAVSGSRAETATDASACKG